MGATNEEKIKNQRVKNEADGKRDQKYSDFIQFSMRYITFTTLHIARWTHRCRIEMNELKDDNKYTLIS